MSMHKQTVWLWLSSLVILCSLITRQNAFAQANRSNGGDVTCAATGSSTQVIDVRSSRFSYVINNTSGLDIRLGLIATGTPALNNTNSILIKGGQPYSDSTPGGYSGRVVCASNTAATAIISFMETYR